MNLNNALAWHPRLLYLNPLLSVPCGCKSTFHCDFRCTTSAPLVERAGVVLILAFQHCCLFPQHDLMHQESRIAETCWEPTNSHPAYVSQLQVSMRRTLAARYVWGVLARPRYS